jgi:hypothetical protein
MKVTLAYPYTDADGKAHDADSSLDLPEHEAVRLLDAGRARTADASTTAETGTSKEKK